MRVVLDSNEGPGSFRADAIRETIAATVVPVEITFAEETGPAEAVGAITDLGELKVCSVRSNAMTVECTPRLAHDSLAPSIFIGLQESGTSLIAQNGREAVLRPGELAFSESTSPYTLVDGEGIRQHFFCIPMAALGLPFDMIKSLAAVSLSPRHPVADLAAAYLHRLGSRPDIISQPGVEAVGRPSIELVRALITTHLDASAMAKDSMHATLRLRVMRLRVMEYTRTHLPDPELSVAEIARAHHVSIRHLYNVLGEGNISLGDWIRTQRLERCRTELTSAGASALPIDSLSRRWGFSSPASFSRAFRATYGMSPREWRDAGPQRVSNPPH